LRASVLIVLVAVLAAAVGQAEASTWSRPIALAPRHLDAHDAKAVWTTRARVVAVLNLQLPSQLAAFSSQGPGSFAPFGKLADRTQSAYALTSTPDGGAVAAYTGIDGIYTATSDGERPFPTPERLPGSEFAGVPILRAAPNGDLFAVWQTSTCDSGCPPLNSVFVAIRPAGATDFDQPQQVSLPGLQSGAPQIVTDRKGGAIVAWVTGADGSVDNSRLVYAVRPAGGTFGPQRAVDPRLGVSGFRLAARPGGRAVVSANWLGVRPVEIASGSVGTGFGSPVALGGRSGDGARVALGPTGGLVGWLEGAGPRSIRVATLAPGRVGRPLTLARGAVHSLKLTIDARRRRIVGWRERGELHVAMWAGAHPPSEQVLVRRDNEAYSLASTMRGDALVTWSTDVHHRWHTRASVAAPGKRFGRSVRLDTPTGSPSGAAIAVGPSGRAIAYWLESPYRGFHNTILVRYYTP
jgi:hypothetical protein